MTTEQKPAEIEAVKDAIVAFARDVNKDPTAGSLASVVNGLRHEYRRLKNQLDVITSQRDRAKNEVSQAGLQMAGIIEENDRFRAQNCETTSILQSFDGSIEVWPEEGVMTIPGAVQLLCDHATEQRNTIDALRHERDEAYSHNRNMRAEIVEAARIIGKAIEPPAAEQTIVTLAQALVDKRDSLLHERDRLTTDMGLIIQAIESASPPEGRLPWNVITELAASRRAVVADRDAAVREVERLNLLVTELTSHMEAQSVESQQTIHVLREELRVAMQTASKLPDLSVPAAPVAHDIRFVPDGEELPVLSHSDAMEVAMEAITKGGMREVYFNGIRKPTVHDIPDMTDVVVAALDTAFYEASAGVLCDMVSENGGPEVDDQPCPERDALSVALRAYINRCVTMNACSWIDAGQTLLVASVSETGAIVGEIIETDPVDAPSETIRKVRIRMRDDLREILLRITGDRIWTNGKALETVRRLIDIQTKTAAALALAGERLNTRTLDQGVELIVERLQAAEHNFKSTSETLRETQKEANLEKTARVAAHEYIEALVALERGR